MTTIRKPASPLPFVMRGDLKHAEILGGRGNKRVFVDEIPLEAWGEDARRLRADWKHLLHSGNAYPVLVAALREVADGKDLQCKAREILRKLGEFKP